MPYRAVSCRAVSCRAVSCFALPCLVFCLLSLSLVLSKWTSCSIYFSHVTHHSLLVCNTGCKTFASLVNVVKMRTAACKLGGTKRLEPDHRSVQNPSQFIFFDGFRSGLRLPELPCWPCQKGYSIVLHFKLESRASLTTNSKPHLFSFLDKVLVSCRIVPYRIVSYRIVSYRIVSYHTVSYRIVPYRILPYRTVSYRTVSYRIVSSLLKSNV